MIADLESQHLADPQNPDPEHCLKLTWQMFPHSLLEQGTGQ